MYAIANRRIVANAAILTQSERKFSHTLPKGERDSF
jgi:hypothetical protein